ncbi:flavin monoamine oxidase family protein [Streptomyces sp. BE303]|uniref:flavin monoamine oxidase family protein n=1 Tax=Streptomyces sp. BE303 TaxID=3002528 RepID=UPI002E773A73|nr:NAD(P)/FAD-dependent oxidoreductase [Streptomyces sp. BE303]MED7950256.1 NAD(P)/FAD-dependent oxidoreductase [Streptomyces sp. BE303]
MLGRRPSEVLMFDESFAFPKSLLTPTAGATGRGAVIGAGIAGLVAGYELQRRGYDIVLYERLNRPGGRVRTHRFWDGTYADLGAMRVPANHHCIQHYIAAFGLRTRPFVNFNPAAYYHLRGHRVRIRDGRSLNSVYALRAEELGAPLDVLDRLLRAVWSSLTADQQRRLLAGRWDDPALDRLTTVSLWQYVHERLSPEAWHLLGHASGLAHYEQSCLLEVLVDYFGLFHLGQVELVDGMDTLVQSFVRALRPGTLRLSTRIDELSLTGSGVRVRGLRLGSPVSDRFDFVVCCVPVPALDQIVFRPDLPHHQQHAIRGISYASSTKVLVHTRRRSWELADGIFGGGSFTDMPIQQCWYPSDNARTLVDGTGPGGSAPGGNGSGGNGSGGNGHRGHGPGIGGSVVSGSVSGSVSTNGDGPAGGPYLVALDPDRSHESAVLTGAYLWGANARRFTTLPQPDRDLLVLKCLERLHPLIRHDVDDIVHWNWDDQIGLGGGAFAHLAPGEHIRYLRGLGTPHPADDPRIYFAGEHLSASHAWMQGAAQSALDVVLRVLDQGKRYGTATVGSRP